MEQQNPPCSSGPCRMPDHSSPEGPSRPQTAPDHRQHGEILAEGCDCLLRAGVGGCGDETGRWVGVRLAGAGHGLVVSLCRRQAAPSVRTTGGMIGINYQKDAIYSVCVCATESGVPGPRESFQWEARASACTATCRKHDPSLSRALVPAALPHCPQKALSAQLGTCRGSGGCWGTLLSGLGLPKPSYMEERAVIQLLFRHRRNPSRKESCNYSGPQNCPGTVLQPMLAWTPQNPCCWSANPWRRFSRV